MAQPQTVMIDINKSPGQQNATFHPDPITIGANVVLAWRNNDSQDHWPGPVANPKGWLDDPIAGKLPHEPAPTSDGIAFPAGATPTTSTTYAYVCAYHSQERGTIIVVGP